MSVFKELRKDGWPLCPRCGEDELQNPWLGQVHFMTGKEPPTIEEFIAAGLSCLNCHWNTIGLEIETRDKIESDLRRKWGTP